jgi:hypothetical protein
MGANVYLESVGAYGYKTEAADIAIVQGIQPVAGTRAAIRSFGMTCGATATSAYFMKVLGQSTLASAVGTGGSAIAFAAEPVSTNELASGDYVGIVLDDGTVHFSEVESGTATSFILTTDLAGAAAAGNVGYFFGAADDNGHFRVLLGASVQTARAEDGGVVYAGGKSEPLIAYHVNDADAAGSIDYITVDYINK